MSAGGISIGVGVNVGVGVSVGVGSIISFLTKTTSSADIKDAGQLGQEYDAPPKKEIEPDPADTG